VGGHFGPFFWDIAIWYYMEEVWYYMEEVWYYMEGFSYYVEGFGTIWISLQRGRFLDHMISKCYKCVKAWVDEHSYVHRCPKKYFRDFALINFLRKTVRNQPARSLESRSDSEEEGLRNPARGVLQSWVWNRFAILKTWVPRKMNIQTAKSRTVPTAKCTMRLPAKSL